MNSITESFNIQLVKLVEQHKCIWDKLYANYQNREEVDTAWEDIGNQTRKPSSDCRLQWRNIRNTYRRSLRRKSGKEYYLSKYLNFIRLFVITEESDTTPTVSSVSNASSISYDAGFGSSNTQLSRSYSSASITSFENIEEDAHISFFKCLLPDLRKMSDEQVRKFRRDVLDLISQVFQNSDNVNIGSNTVQYPLPQQIMKESYCNMMPQNSPTVQHFLQGDYCNVQEPSQLNLFENIDSTMEVSDSDNFMDLLNSVSKLN